MARALIIGSGTSGLVLATGLQADGWQVDLFTRRTTDEIIGGPAQLTQLTFPTSRATEAGFGLDFWSTAAATATGGTPVPAPPFTTIRLTMAPPDAAASSFTGRQQQPGTAIDHRAKTAEWLSCFEERGGSVHVKTFTDGDLLGFAATGMHDLIVVATGADSELAARFPHDAGRSGGATDRVITQAHLVGAAPGTADVDVVTTPHGEIFTFPVLALADEAVIDPDTAEPQPVPVTATCVQVFARPGSALDPSAHLDHDPSSLAARRPRVRARQAWDRSLRTLAATAPDIARRCAQATVLENSLLFTRLTPSVRAPVVDVAGSPVLAIGDASLTIDPTSGQGADASSLAAATIRAHIADRRAAGGVLDAAFLRDAYAAYWERHGQYTSGFSTMVRDFWSGALPPHVLEVFARAATDPQVADAWVAGFDNPTSLDWLLTP
ncbi:hypothetical protein [Nocardiopsis sp. CNT312]|uniref:hypothetical protein n=1 Tax=Nocardiopsis sp. CNT312 TaxID=1137268 RepID=UPI0004B3844F|nr:hypothetical protein [Nocardiopsis sp. CNT312]